MDGKDKIHDIDGSVDWRPSRRICRSGEAVAEWPSCIQVDNGTPSTPPFKDSDNDSCDEFKSSEMYRDFTWMVEKFSEVSKKPKLISEVFKVNGYKWCILMFPQGSDLCNQYLYLYLCVANHTQLLPGWGHFSQFTLALVNKDGEKNKYSDNIHRFCRKEHAVGWQKFIELSKLQDGFLANDTLKIKAQVQIIRKRAHRLFHCLDHHYRRELLVRWLSRVQQVCCKFIKDQKSKVRNFLKDKARWSRLTLVGWGWTSSSPPGTTLGQVNQTRPNILGCLQAYAPQP
ncbi:hypothetical protein QQ045_022994 [Rhodiola kirilowii]